MTPLQLDLLRHGWTPITEERLARDRALQAALRDSAANLIRSAAVRLQNLAERIAVDKVQRPV